MKKLFNLLLSLMVISFLMSCTSTKFLNPENDVVPLQSLAKEGDTILLIDATKEATLVKSLLGDEIGSKAKEITVQITPIDDSYPLDKFNYNAVVEGDFPFFTTNFALTHFTDFNKVLESSKSYYKKDNTEIGVIHANMIGVSSDSYLALVDIVDSKVENVDKLTALDMYNSNFALYSYKPKTLFDFGLGLTKTMINHFDSIVILINENEENKMLLDAKFEVDTDSNASTLEKLVKTGYTANLKKAGEKLDFTALKLMFDRNGNILKIEGMPLTDEQITLLKDKLQTSDIGL